MSKITKYILSVLTIVILVGLLISCGSKRQNLSDLITDRTELRVFEVFGMDCPGCHGGLENQIDKIPGVVASKANWEKQQVEIVIDKANSVNDEMIFTAIEKANFTPGKRIR